MKIVWLREQFPWMGQYSGYGVFCRCYQQVFGDEVSSVFRNPVRNNLNGDDACVFDQITRTPFYTLDGFVAEKDAYVTAQQEAANLIHILYAENNFSTLCEHYKETGVKVVASVHQPESWWLEHCPDLSFLNSLDHILTVSEESKQFISRHVPEARVSCILHGIDMDFWGQGERKHTGGHVLVVGHWLRDFKLIFEVVRALKKIDPAITFKFVLKQSVRTQHIINGLNEFSNCEVLEGVSDAGLRNLYREARCLFLPLKDATANNAILEAMAVGIPIVSNSNTGVDEYFGANKRMLISGESSNDYIEMIQKCVYSKEYDDFGKRLKERARSLDWKNLVGEMRKVYLEVLGQPVGV